MSRKVLLLYYFFLSFILLGVAQEEKNPFTTPAQLGFTGLLFTPSAYVPAWPTLDIGFTHLSQETAFTYDRGTSPERSFIASVVFFPSVELSLKLTRPYSNLRKNPSTDGRKYWGIGDRSISLRVQALKETKYRPAILIGIQDPSSNLAFFNTSYIVLSKKSKFKGIDIAATMGYGGSWIATSEDFLAGPFGGIQAYWQSFSGLVEYDTKQLNIGLAYQLKEFVYLKVALIDARYFTGNINFRFRLN